MIKNTWIKCAGQSNCIEVKWLTACESNGCVEVAHEEDEVLIRDSKNPRGPVLSFTVEEWDAFVEGIYDGAFNR